MTMRYDNPLYAMVGALESGTDQAIAAERSPTVTVSRSMGSGGDIIAHRFAEKLQMHCFDKEILEQVAKRASASPHIIKRLHEADADPTEAGLYAMVTGEHLTEENYLDYLTMVMKWAHNQGGVIVGRAGHLLIESPNILRVRITGTENGCAARIAAEEMIDPAIALERVRKSRSAREGFMQRHFKSTYYDPDLFDVTVCTDRFENLDRAVDVLVAAFKAKGGMFTEWADRKAVPG